MSLNDREYMYSSRRGSPRTDGRSMLLILIAINAVMFLIAPPPSPRSLPGGLYESLGLYIQGGFSVENIYQLLTAGFLHGNFSHILFNMWGLYIFGALVAPHMSGIKFLILYLAGVLSGNLIFLLFNLHNSAFLVGASGAVCAVMAAAATLEPNRKFVMLFLPFAPMKTTTLVICYTLLEVLFEVTGTDRGVAHLAHLGGFLGGYIVMKIFFGSRLPWDPFRIRRGARPQNRPQPNYSWTSPPRPEHSETSGSPVSQRELDGLLDKLSKNGINSLSEYELERLRRARRQMRGEE